MNMHWKRTPQMTRMTRRPEHSTGRVRVRAGPNKIPRVLGPRKSYP
jgi:hypothetical protein